ncbi:hypothetical protein L3073_07325 [Ancylomarina sp. DW003]|nr:hypothetical protein [Ancylomarina sp. DW003]MDE5422016.1 hypothetical protein [Ancylomarina sp. DW003]
MDIILLLTHSRDFFTIDNVEAHINKLGYKTLRINTDQYPTQINLDFEIKQHNSPQKTISIGGEEINVKRIKAVWLRRIWSPEMPEDIDPAYSKYCSNEASNNLLNFLHTLNNIFWLDHLEYTNRAENKLYQMEQANKFGIAMPNTLISNNPDKILKFYHQNKGNIITKMQTVLSVSMDGSGQSFRTSKVNAEDLENLSSVQYCPMIFQTEILKKAEYRVVYVDGEFFSGKITTDTLDNASPDIKSNQSVSWEIGSLPQYLCEQISRFMESIELRFGVMDIVETPSGEFQFLEINPVGEWGMLEKELDLPISHAIAKTIVKQIKINEKDTINNASKRQFQH